MAENYSVGIVPDGYNQAWLTEELQRISLALQELETPQLLLIPQNVAPSKVKEGMIMGADGTNWNPGHGKGLYEYVGGVWRPLFSLGQGFVTARVTVQNTTTETELYSTVLVANSLSTDSLLRVTLGGDYDTGTASDTWTLRFKLNGTTIHSAARHDTGNVAGAGLLTTFNGTTRSVGASGTLHDIILLQDNDALGVESSATLHTLDTTVANTFSVTVQWGSAKAGNIFRLEHGYTNFLH